MTLLVPFVLVAYVVLYAFALSIPPLALLPHFLSGAGKLQTQRPLLDSLDAWIEREETIALERLLDNVAPGGKNTQGNGVVDGTVLASPSTSMPDYFFQWVRDAAITTQTLVDLYKADPSSERASQLATILDAYAQLQAGIQHTNNPSGSFSDLAGLGEPKFEVDGSPFTGSWGRPQRDGPALRAITLMSYLRAYNASHPALWDTEKGEDWFKPFYQAEMPANSIIKADLEYVSHVWTQGGFDLWEEVQGLHFFTAMVQLKALREGADLAHAFDDLGAAAWYSEQAAYLEDFLQMFWDEEKGHLIETMDSPRSGLDCGILLGSLHALPSETSNLDPVFPPWSDEILVTLLALANDQRSRFPINSKPIVVDEDEDLDQDEGENVQARTPFSGTGIGRYPEDIYTGTGTAPGGGNPWFLCTSSAAEILYRTASHISTSARLTITPRSHPFYAALLADSSLELESEAEYGPSDAIFQSIVDRLRIAGDEFLDVVKTHVDGEGRMSEQFDGVTGYMRGARDLTWSYGAFLKAVWARGEEKD
ncbi:hypothetical protein BS50DRAFT_134287 [Corynespora cassiicola Philippines]|uniref:glucan 1,4-alpha-glucosidase n=1 Tax=Corynespora cassiicola Philippines TaxID=1448308 RepID=A0A2T2N962_CORCC|nr:hypothetical protein BS50DRAFT_134287 [Corynespora cassiicola Philippines]